MTKNTQTDTSSSGTTTADRTPIEFVPLDSAPIRENLGAPEILADEAAFFSVNNGLLTMTLTRQRFEHAPSGSSTPVRAVVARITLPLQGGIALGWGLGNYLHQLQAQVATETAQPPTGAIN